MDENKEMLETSEEVAEEIADETAEEIEAEPTPEELEKAEKDKIKRYKKRHRKEKAFGYAVIVLSLIGLCSVFYWGYKGVTYLMDDSADRLEYQKMLTPVVMQDPAEFSNVADCTNDFLLRCGMWAVLTKNDTDRYDTNEFGEMIIPAVDVDQWITYYFGSSGYNHHHESIVDYTSNFIFDDATACYTVTVGEYLGGYAPYVTEMSKSKEQIVLKVGYVSNNGTPSSEFIGQVYTPEVEKYERYVLTKGADGQFHISSIQKN